MSYVSDIHASLMLILHPLVTKEIKSNKKNPDTVKLFFSYITKKPFVRAALCELMQNLNHVVKSILAFLFLGCID